MAKLRPLLIYVGVLIVVLAAAFGLGYVYEHDPERDLVEVVIDRSGPVDQTEVLSGTVADVRDGSVVISTEFGPFEVLLADVTLEELRALEAPERIAEGLPLNLGGERTPSERVISGVVLIAPEAAP